PRPLGGPTALSGANVPPPALPLVSNATTFVACGFWAERWPRTAENAQSAGTKGRRLARIPHLQSTRGTRERTAPGRLLARASSYLPRLPGGGATSGRSGLSSALTAAGPRRIHTSLPVPGAQVACLAAAPASVNRAPSRRRARVRRTAGASHSACGARDCTARAP